MKYRVYLAQKTESEVVFEGTKEEALELEEILRRECRAVDPNGTVIDCFIRSEEEEEAIAEICNRWDALTEEDKKDIIEVDGKKYIKKLYLMSRGGESK